MPRIALQCSTALQSMLTALLPRVLVVRRAGIAGHVALTGEIVNIEDAHLDPRFDSSMDTKA